MRVRAVAERPNIIVLLADDLGYSDLGCFKSPYVKTPNLDKLAADGLRLTASYSGAPICSPARASLMTGRISTRTGVYSYIPEDLNHPMHLRMTEVTIASRLRDADYQTAQFGKWHLNAQLDPAFGQPGPNKHGFDYCFGVGGQPKPTFRDPDNFWRNGEKVGQLYGYSCEIVVNDAINWIENQRDKSKPFFSYINFNEPHNPILPADDLPSDIMALYNLLPITDLNKRYYASITNMDCHIGRFLDKLDELRLRENTLVVFLSDNGPHDDKGENSKRPLRGSKSDVYEGGIRTPGIIRWPGHTTAGCECDEPITFVDFAPTFAELAGTSMPTDRKIDGISFLPIFDCKPLVRKTPMFWYFYREVPQVAMRQDDWVLIGRRTCPFPDASVNPLHQQFLRCHMQYIKMENAVFNGFNFKNTAWEGFELYNIRRDISQTDNLAASEPKRFNVMRQKMVRLYNEVVADGYRWPDSAFAGTAWNI